ncbi:hypothetical protein F4821DRAFT_279240 [Hypoxylon rubiginosum]|uniref:Uncharacterized protein n=1 Tax=Hypoxylon rubiginosum TaxID=110542 RepID=A0ACC0CYL6_9PEZI|nr:hypothetical protein F4821DRAFT_279240 [Hypoxylon rubiginosum]
MCFTEFVGYTCGHTSLSVKRFCPLTTQLHNNPCCTNNAVRPILAPNFCYGCARVIHGRWVDILESEHRFMHERGVCGCSVVFPHLQQPRVVSHYVDDADDTDDQPGGVNDGEQRGGSVTPTQRSRGTTYTTTTYSGLSGSATPFTPSIKGSGTFHEAEDVSYDSNTMPFGPSTSNQSARPTTDSNAAATSVSPAGSSSGGSKRGKGRQRRGKKAQKGSTGRSGHNQQFSNQSQQLAPLFEERQSNTNKKPSVSVRTPSLYGAEWLQDHKILHDEGRCSCAVRFERYESREMSIADEAGSQNHTEITTLAEYNQQYPQESASGNGEGSSRNPMASSIPHVTTNPGNPARWACSPETSAENNAGVGSHASHPIDMQTAWYNNESEVPLAGLPIGAGPEGDSHMPPFQTCELNIFTNQEQENYYPETSRHRRGVSF